MSPPERTGAARRRFIERTAAAIAGFGVARQVNAGQAKKATSPAWNGWIEYLRAHTVSKESLDLFLDPKARAWARFHPTYGYLLRNSFIRDGMDGSHTLARYEPTGQRFQVNFRAQPCRINTYGDSFTQGHQVSDAETWQECLAGHFCEPIRNFGIGGFGVYQAYRRLLDTEATDLGVKFLIFNIWGDDHYRSVYSWRSLTFSDQAFRTWSGRMFHANPWVHARLDPQNGNLVERPNLCPDEATLRRLNDPDFVVETFKDDEVSQVAFASRTGMVIDQAAIERMRAAVKGLELDWSAPAQVRQSADRLLHAYSIRVGMKIMEKLNDYVREKGKKLMVLLSYPSGSIQQACAGAKQGSGPGEINWHPPEFTEFLQSKQILYVDSLTKHVEEFKTFRLTPKEYVDRYYIGHYTPRGNQFFAFAIKNELLAWLDPKPPAYRDQNDPPAEFKGYLPS